MTTATSTASPSAFFAHGGPGFSTGTDTWETPQDLFDALHEEFGFVLDCAALAGSAKCGAYFGPDHVQPSRRDALRVNWAAEAALLGGACWLNPPYSRALLAPFVRKAHAEAQRGATVVLLIPARTDTAVWHDYVVTGEVRFLRGRVKFGTAKSGAPFPSAIVVFGPATGRTAVSKVARSRFAGTPDPSGAPSMACA